jgi:hypothetical protein
MKKMCHGMYIHGMYIGNCYYAHTCIYFVELYNLHNGLKYLARLHYVILPISGTIFKNSTL